MSGQRRACLRKRSFDETSPDQIDNVSCDASMTASTAQGRFAHTGLLTAGGSRLTTLDN
jgi:hypothetical protein